MIDQLLAVLVVAVCISFGFISGTYMERRHKKDRAEVQILEIVKWQHETFPQANASSKIAHLAQEVEELASDVRNRSVHTQSEFADCFLLLFGAAYAYGLNWKTIWRAMDEKMTINKSRKWGKPDANGVINHIK